MFDLFFELSFHLSIFIFQIEETLLQLIELQLILAGITIENRSLETMKIFSSIRVQRNESTRSLRSVTLPVVWVTNRLWRMSLFLEVSFVCSIVLSSASRSFCLAILKHSCATIDEREHRLTVYLECVAVPCRGCSFVISTNRSSFDELLSSLQVHALFRNCPDSTELSSLVS